MRLKGILIPLGNSFGDMSCPIFYWTKTVSFSRMLADAASVPESSQPPFDGILKACRVWGGIAGQPGISWVGRDHDGR
jgi:hypothetical protein